MKKFTSLKLLASALSFSLVFGSLMACGNTATTPAETTTAGSETAAATTTAGAETTTAAESTTAERAGDALVVAYDNFSQKFSPFFGETAYDMDVSGMTQVSMLTTDRAGGIVFNAADGETIEYNGTPYLYEGIANLSINKDDAAKKTVYTFKMRDDIKFSDGEALTADDVIFSLYVLLDPTYNGSSTTRSLDIVGLNDYLTQTSTEVYDKYETMYYDIFAAGPDHVWADGDAWTEEQQTFFWDNLKQVWTDDVQAIVDTVYNDYGADYAQDTIEKSIDEVGASEGLKVALGMALWGYGEVVEGKLTTASGVEFDLNSDKLPTIEDYYNEVYTAYEGDPVAYWDVEKADSDSVEGVALAAFIQEYGPKDDAMGGEGIPNISGIKKLSDTEVEVTLNNYDAAAVYQLGISVAPLHYYGDEAEYDYEANKFGHPYGDLALIEAKTTEPMGAGPYKFVKYENKIVYFEANDLYFKGAPVTQNIQFKETAEADKVSGILSGDADISNPSFSTTVVDEIKAANSNGELTGDKIETNTVNNLGYGYIGINAATMNVGGEPDSEASKNLRRAFATIFAVYRDFTVNTYYGERANVINYPISDTSWAAPKPTDEGYRVAFSADVDGADIYTADMSDEDKYKAALEAAKGFFVAAGYTLDEATGKFTAAPEGAKLQYEAIIPAGGKGDHPNFKLFDSSKQALAELGIDFVVTDPADANVLWDRLNAGTQEIWSAAWGATIDPDMYQIYHSSNIVGLQGSSESNHYHIQDGDLDQLIMDARTSDDQAFRKATYKAALDVIIDWAVEVPVYQRQNCFTFSTERLDTETLAKDQTTFYSWLSEIENIAMK